VTGSTGIGRLTLVSHAATDAMSAGRFPGDEPLNHIGFRQADALVDLDIRSDTHQLCGPERRTRQTARALGLKAETEPRLADIDCGRWCGETLDSISPGDLSDWLTDPLQAPHGGESVVDLIARVTSWLASVRPLRSVAVTHPAVVRAAILIALDAPPKSFWRIDIAPVSCTVLHYRGGRWTLRL
jgi:broad specificity phosphatase PhoE